jgi:UbiD family decarboxylase
MTAITKAFDGSKALVANNIKDYPNAHMYSNLYATQERTAKLLGVSEYKDIKHKILDAYRNPLPANYVESADAPVHETVIPASDIDQITDILPIILHTNQDGGRIFGSGCHLIGSPWVPDGGNTISMYRMAFRDGQKYASINMVSGGQGGCGVQTPSRRKNSRHCQLKPAGRRRIDGCRYAQPGGLPRPNRQDRHGRCAARLTD